MTMVMLITFPARSVKWDNGSKIYPSLHMFNPITSYEPSMSLIDNYQNVEKSCTMLINLLKIFIDTGIPFDSFLFNS